MNGLRNSVYYEAETIFLYVLQRILFQMKIKKVNLNIPAVVQHKIMIITLHLTLKCVTQANNRYRFLSATINITFSSSSSERFGCS